MALLYVESWVCRCRWEDAVDPLLWDMAAQERRRPHPLWYRDTRTPDLFFLICWSRRKYTRTWRGCKSIRLHTYQTFMPVKTIEWNCFTYQSWWQERNWENRTLLFAWAWGSTGSDASTSANDLSWRLRSPYWNNLDFRDRLSVCGSCRILRNRSRLAGPKLTSYRILPRSTYTPVMKNWHFAGRPPSRWEGSIEAGTDLNM